MNRSEGLVQRRNVVKDNSDPASKENNDVDDKKNDKSYDDGDSKETRLTLMEEVLLLGLKDKEVSVVADVAGASGLPPAPRPCGCDGSHVNVMCYFRVTHRFGMIAYPVV